VFSIEFSLFLNQLATRPIHLPPQWSASVHPEGKIYFHQNSGLRVVTESYLYNSVTAENTSAWVIEVEERASKKGFTFTDRTELFLELDGNDCNYYFVDHGARMLFWIDIYSTSELGISPVASSSHLSKPNLFGWFRGILILYLRNAAGSSILDPHRKFLYAHWWSSSQDNRRSHWYFHSWSSR